MTQKARIQDKKSFFFDFSFFKFHMKNWFWPILSLFKKKKRKQIRTKSNNPTFQIIKWF